LVRAAVTDIGSGRINGPSMFFLYSLILSVGYIVLLPRFLYDVATKGKYAAGFGQRMGFLPRFDAGGKPVIWIHCVSVGETNAARPLVERIKRDHPGFRIVISTTTLTGQTLAKRLFADIADLVIYFPFDWKLTVRRVLRRLKPSIVLLMETEIWFNFIHEAHRAKARLAIVNGRLSERSFKRFSYIRKFIRRIMSYLDIALMQDNADAQRMMSLGLRAGKVKVTGNMKFDHDIADDENALTEEFRERFAITDDAPLVIAASTHSPEETWILDAFKQLRKPSGTDQPRLMIVPRHPERFDAVADEISRSGLAWVRRSETGSLRDETAEVILLDSIGELRAAYPLAEIVFVGGSLIHHGGQSIFEPAAAGKAIITGPHTSNFESAVAEFLAHDAIIQLSNVRENAIVPELVTAISKLLSDGEYRSRIGSNAREVMSRNRGAVSRTLEYLAPLFAAARTR
jgi:3-deoxy-D-manno-octulosonic-acid transferase